MLVSAISRLDGASYNFSSNKPYYNLKVDSEENVSGLGHSNLRGNVPQEDVPMVLDSINQWKNFCHGQILGEKLNIIA